MEEKGVKGNKKEEEKRRREGGRKKGRQAKVLQIETTEILVTF